MALILEFPKPARDDEPNSEIIEILEALLKRARNGDVQSLVAVAAGGDGHPDVAMAMDRGAVIGFVGSLRTAERGLLQALDVTRYDE